MKVLKTAFEELTNTRSENADKMKIVCNASTAVINDHPEVPSFLSSEEKEGKGRPLESFISYFYRHLLSVLCLLSSAFCPLPFALCPLSYALCPMH